MGNAICDESVHIDTLYLKSPKIYTQELVFYIVF